MNGQLLLPGKTAQLKAVLFSCQLKLTAKGCQADISVGNGGLVLKNDIDLVTAPPGGVYSVSAQGACNGCYLRRLGVQPRRENDAEGIRIDLSPTQGGRIASKLLRKDQRGSQTDSQ